MSGLGDIPVRVESSTFVPENVLTGMADAVLREVLQHLEVLRDRGESHTIDLHSLPLTEADRAQLRNRLGKGEVEITIDASGPTAIYETGFAGVWWIDYQNLLGSSAIQQIEITQVPQMVATHSEDVAVAVRQLAASLEREDGDPPNM